MRTTKAVLAATMTLALTLGSTVAVVAQDEEAATDPYLAGSLAGTLVGDPENPLGCDPIVAPDGTEFPVITMSGNAVGVTTLLGQTTMTSQNCYVPLDIMANIQSGVYTLTGESGDELSGAWNGDCAPSFVFGPGDTYQCYGLLDVTGGSGAFEGATGMILMTVELWDAGIGPDGIGYPFPMEMRLEGLIDY